MSSKAWSEALKLICRGAARQFHLLRDFYRELVVLEAVWHEVIVAEARRAGAGKTVRAREQRLLKVQAPGHRPLVESPRALLGAGEAEAIALATELHADHVLIKQVSVLPKDS